MTSPQLTARLSNSPADTRRGVVRLPSEVLDALGLRPWNAVHLTGERSTVALAAPAIRGTAPGVLLLDEITLLNLGARENAQVAVTPAQARPAMRITITGSHTTRAVVSVEIVRKALAGKVFCPGDAVSMLPQDLSPDAPSSRAAEVRRALGNTIGRTWTSELLTIAETEPAGAVTVHPSTVVTWQGDTSITASPGTQHVPAADHSSAGFARSMGANPGSGSPVGAMHNTEHTGPKPAPGTTAPGPASATAPVVNIDDLIGARTEATRLTEWLRLSFEQPDLVRRLGAEAHLGVLVSGPSGVGKATLARAASRTANAELVELAAPSIAALQASTAAQQLHEAVDGVRRASNHAPRVLLISDVEALVPATDPPPLATIALDTLRAAVSTAGVAVLVTSAQPQEIDPRLREPGLIDRELTLGAPNAAARADLLGVLLRPTPLADDVDLPTVAERTPGFVAADLVALRRDAAVTAALRQQHSEQQPELCQQDLLDAVESVRPLSMSTTDEVRTGGLTLDDVGDMTEVKQALTETVLWPLRYPDSFARLGVQPPRGVLLYGPPGCGKTFLVRALAGAGQLNVLAVKGAELMDKWVGESERAVRELFLRAANAAPTLIFLDEVDALAPRRGQSADSGVGDRVVAALLTELDGAEPLNDVVVLGATNRPELVDPALLRPGRLERPVYVPPPDSAARAEVLRTAARNTPLSSDVDLERVAAELAGYSAADCTALLREAALSAMRESLSATEVTAAHLDTARETVRPSLDPA